MIMDIKPIHDNINNCLDDAIATIALWYGCGYKLMYCESWGFYYDTTNAETVEVVGDKIRANVGDKLKLVNRYHGVNFTPIESKYCEEMLNEIYEEISINRPLLLYIDTYYVPWTPSYRIDHRNHFCIVSGINSNKSLHCIDGLPICYGAELSVDDFRNGVQFCMKSSHSEKKLQKVEPNIIISNAIERLVCKDKSINAFDSIRALAYKISEELDLAKEMQGYNNFNLTHLFNNLIEIGRGRLQFAKVLMYIADKKKISELIAISEYLYNIGLKWNKISAIMLKSYVSSKDINLKQRVAKYLNELANDEEQVAMRLSKVKIL